MAKLRRKRTLLIITKSEGREGVVGPEPAAASGGNRQAERREPQGAALGCDYAGSPEATDKPLPGSMSEKIFLNRSQTRLTDPGSFQIRRFGR